MPPDEFISTLSIVARENGIIHAPDTQPIRGTPSGSYCIAIDRLPVRPALFKTRFCNLRGENKVIPRPRHSNIEQSQLFLQGFVCLTLPRQPIWQAWISCAGFGRFHERTKAVFIIENEVAPQVREVEWLGKVSDNDDGKLQSFTLMDAHQANGVFLRKT